MDSKQYPSKRAPVASPAKPTSAPSAAHTKSAPAQAPSTTLKIGNAQVANDIYILPSKYEMVNSLGTDNPKDGDAYLVITFTIDNKSKTASFNFDPASLVIMDASGKSLSWQMVKSETNELSAKMLKPGDKLDGVIVYEVPKEDKSLVLEFKTASSPTLQWMIG